jgi:mannose-6-phosphate isomerase-like protein (cupin superfamily)
MMKPLCLAFIFSSMVHAQTIRVIKLSEAKSFGMANGTSMRILQPSVGAKKLSLNYSSTQPGREFQQHVHQYSDDTILILQGQSDLRQGSRRTPIRAGQCAFVPAGQIHGTVTTAPDTVSISFQVPPDLAIYRGTQDSSKPPDGVITPGAVKFVDFGTMNGYFISPAKGMPHASAARRILKLGERFTTTVDRDAEQLLFVWKGALLVNNNGSQYDAGERDTVFVCGPARLDVRAVTKQDTVVIQVQAPPGSGR